MKRLPAVVLALAAVASLVWVTIPLRLIHPFKPQTPGGIALSHALRSWAPLATAVFLVAGLVCAVVVWRRSGWKGRALVGLPVIILLLCAALGRWNIYERMFRPLPNARYVDAEQAAFVAADDMILGVHSGAQARAYPVLALAYHHIVNDEIGGEPVVATYCTLCHTGIVWKARLGERTLHFALAAINNQNALMKDDETGSWWQQSTGCAVAGTLKGQCLTPHPWDEVSFAVWKAEHPGSKVLAPDEATKHRYETADWETEILGLPTVATVDPADKLALRDLVIGVETGGAAKAYPLDALAAGAAISDSVGETPLLIVLHPDGKSVRCFDRRVGGNILEFEVIAGAGTVVLGNPATGSAWTFTGAPASGSADGSELKQIPCLKSYWFDWKNQHPATTVFP